VRSSLKITLCAGLLLGLAFSSAAATIELEATGTITASDFVSVPVGTSVTAFLFYDPSAAPDFSTATSASYDVPQGVIFDFGTSSLMGGTSASAAQILSLLDNTVPGFEGISLGDDAIAWIATSPTASGPIASDPGFDATGITSLALNFEAPDSDGVLTSTALPSPFPSLPGQWTEGSFFYVPVTGSNPPYGNFSGVFDSVTEVPEPGFGAVCLGGMMAAFLLRRRKTSR
jgi:hypothetical protein